MTAEQLKARTLEGFERMFNSGELGFVDGALAPGAVDHQEPEGTDFAAHLKHVISTLRAAFPDLASRFTNSFVKATSWRAVRL